MRQEMERMEEEREQMVAEVEAQIERALQSMTIEDDDEMFQNGDSRPLSPRFSPLSGGQRDLRSRSAPGSRRQSVSATFDRVGFRGSFATDTTAIEPPLPPLDRTLLNGAAPTKPSAGEAGSEKPSNFGNGNDDGLDAGITEKSDKIAQKVLQIQQKVRYLHSL
jgi:nicotinamide N-methyltransferase